MARFQIFRSSKDGAYRGLDANSFPMCTVNNKGNFPSSVLRPGRHDASHARVGDQLTHVLVGMNNDTKIHSIHRRIPIGDVYFTRKVIGGYRQMSRSEEHTS